MPYSTVRKLGIVGRAKGDGCVAAGNLLADSRVPVAMVKAFENSEGQLAERLILAMQAGVAAGGEAYPVYLRAFAWHAPILSGRLLIYGLIGMIRRLIRYMRTGCGMPRSWKIM